MNCSHEHRVNDTRSRSLLKAVSGRIIEIIVGTTIQGTMLSMLGFHSAYELGFMMTVVEETTCFIISYINDRLWNRLQWGRKIEDVENE